MQRRALLASFLPPLRSGQALTVTTLTLGAFGALALAACSDAMAPVSRVHDTTVPAAPSPSSTHTAGPPEDAAPAKSDDDAGVNDGGDMGAGVTRRGAVFAISDTVASGATHRLGAYFVEQRGGKTAAADVKLGPCVLATMSGDDEAPTEKDVSAGAVALRLTARTDAGTSATTTTTLSPSTRGTYTTQSARGALWQGGEDVTLTLAGVTGGVPMATIATRAPSTLTVVSDDAGATFAARDLAAIDRTKPLDVAWTGSSAGVVIAYFDLADRDTARTLTCSFDASAGRGTIPVAAWAALGAGDGTFSLYAKNSTTVPATGWSIAWNMSTTLVDAQGIAALGRVTYR